MPIVNAHTHLIEIEAMFKKYPGGFVSSGVSVYNNAKHSLALLFVDTMIDQMDESEIEKSIVYALEAPILYSSNEYVSSLCKKYPDRLIGFASVDPKSSQATKVLQQAICEKGLKGLKLHPPLQNFFPNDESVFPVYEKAMELDIPVVFHVGTTPFASRCKLSQANPLLLDDVANQFPKLRIMLTHLGTLWHNEAFMIVEKHPNVFIDTAGYLYEIPRLLDHNLVKRLGKHKIIFGTDYPSPFAEDLHRMKDFVDCLNSLSLPSDVLDSIFYDNVHLLLDGMDSGDELSEEFVINELSLLSKVKVPDEK